ncbi:Ubiquitin fusion degradation protein [Lasiodiplodia theobromae]|uniref:Ubiquitin fusion degradation protein n=1 Tax=Lasiodiplodia theobromae TaxID=45133 RepID=UPI0015C39254|nr:Ubiquitin fusion degradation protein [Lasiodiplodia theobromae]KAF4544953.1 Ubiquitin fusion degradation protein [Lasiodiplodia theobromae]
MAAAADATTPITLYHLLSNSLLLRQIAPYLPPASLFSLALANRAFQALVYHSPDAFRYLDLSTLKSTAIADKHEPLDRGGNNWRAERMDEALTEDEFYCGPLRGIFSRLADRHILECVHTLVLDGLSVPADLVREIIAEDRFNVRILSIREAEHLNEHKLQQVLRYAVRPTRPPGTPRLKGLYVFGAKDPGPATEPVSSKKQRSPPRTPGGVMSSLGAQIGAEWNQRSSDALSCALARSEHHKWYQSEGRVLRKRPSPEWAETLRACEGIIFFDAVLCRGPRHDIAAVYAESGSRSAYLPPAVASVALGPVGCQSCHDCPEGPAVFGSSPAHHLPLLSPPLLHSSIIRAAQKPSMLPGTPPPKLVVRCEECLRGRWCERCNKWWDEKCYAGSASAVHTNGSTLTAMQQTEALQEMAAEGNPPRDIKVHMGLCTAHCLVEEMMSGAGSAEQQLSTGEQGPKGALMISAPALFTEIGVKRECFGCGPTCADCKALFIRACRTCRNEYCIIDNDGSSAIAV